MPDDLDTSEAIASGFSAHREASGIRVTGTLVGLDRGESVTLAMTDAVIDHDPTELRLALTATDAGDSRAHHTPAAVDTTFDVDPTGLTHVVIELCGDVVAERYSGDSLNLPID